MHPELHERWQRLLKSYGAIGGAVDAAWARLNEAYAAPTRKYHDLAHLADVLDHVDRLAAHAHDVRAVRLAAWYHDVVYDPRRDDNEEQSAETARQALSQLKLPLTVIASVGDLILRTKTHDAPDDDWNARVLVDADLAILGSSPKEYRAYAEAIRQEYAWVPEDQYRAGRTTVLRRFLDRPRIYRTDQMFVDREAQSRRNLENEIVSLSTSA